MSRSAIETMLESPSLSIQVLASLGKALLEYTDRTIVCTICERLYHVSQPAFMATTLAGSVRDAEDPSCEIQVYHVMALCKRHALYHTTDSQLK